MSERTHHNTAKQQLSHTKLGAKFPSGTTNGNEVRYTYDPADADDDDPTEFETDTDTDTDGGGPHVMHSSSILKKSPARPELQIPFSNTNKNRQGTAATRAHEADHGHENDFPITFHRIKVNGSVSEYDDEEQYHYHNGMGSNHMKSKSKTHAHTHHASLFKHAKPQQSKPAPREPEDTEETELSDDDDEDGSDPDSDYNTAKTRVNFDRNEKELKGCLKKPSNHENGATGVTQAQSKEHNPLKHSERRKLGVLSSSSGGSMISCRESSSMTPMQGINGLDGQDHSLSRPDSASQLILVTEQLDGIQRTQDSILNKLKNDMDSLQNDNTKLKKENDSLRARTAEMNGIIDQLTNDLDRIKIRLAKHGEEVVNSSSPIPTRRNSDQKQSHKQKQQREREDHNSDTEQKRAPERKDSSTLCSPSVLELAKKYGINVPSVSAKSKLNSTQPGELNNQTTSSAAVLEIENPHEKDGGIKPLETEITPEKPKRRKKRSSSRERKRSHDHESQSGSSTKKNSSSRRTPKNEKHKSRQKTTNSDTDVSESQESSHRHQPQPTTTAHVIRKKASPVAALERKKEQKPRVHDSSSSIVADVKNDDYYNWLAKEKDKDRNKYRKSMSEAYSKVRQGVKSTRKESKKLGRGCFRWLGFGKKHSSDAEDEVEATTKDRRVNPTKLMKSTKPAPHATKRKNFPVVTLTESHSSITTRIRGAAGGGGGAVRSGKVQQSNKQVVVTVAVSDEDVDEDHEQGEGMTESDDQEYQKRKYHHRRN